MRTESVWFIPAVAAGVLTFVALAIGTWQLICGHNMEAANWVMAAGGLGLIVFSAVQLHREARREAAALSAARAKLKPAAWLARRMCEQGVIESNGKVINQWLWRWYTPQKQRMMEGGGPPNVLDVLEELMRETVTLAAEAGGQDMRAADAAFSAFIVAANILNELSAVLSGVLDNSVYQAAIPKARTAASYLASAARELSALAPRGDEEPAVPAAPKFLGET